MREQLAIARKQLHDAHTHGQMAEARAHLDFTCDLLVRVALRRHLEIERELMDTHDEGQHGRALTMVAVITAMLEMIESKSVMRGYSP